MRWPQACLMLAGLVGLGILAGAPPVLAAPMPSSERTKVADEMEAYLWKHVLKPRFPACVDGEHGGFHTNYGRDWKPLPDRGRFIVYEARVVWTAATLARLRPDTAAEYLPYVRHGVRYLADVMWDRENGGFHTFVDLQGKPIPFGWEPGRPVYGQAFAIYALAAAHAVTGDDEPLELARRGYRWIEDHYRDDLGPGYRSSVQPNGKPIPAPARDASFSGASGSYPDTLRTMNDHIHILEAYAALLREWPDPDLRQRTQALLGFVRDRIFVEPGCLYVALWPNGRPVPAPTSFGHDVETAFLMIETEEALGREPSAATLRAARMLVDHALGSGFNPQTGQLYESGPAFGPPLDRSIEWWGQFEMFHVLQMMDDRYGNETDRYQHAFRKAWDFARDVLADTEAPGVCARADENGKPVCGAKSYDWFASYHTARALLFTADRLRSR
jgi:mannobiose 2-epimerase